MGNICSECDENGRPVYQMNYGQFPLPSAPLPPNPNQLPKFNHQTNLPQPSTVNPVVFNGVTPPVVNFPPQSPKLINPGPLRTSQVLAQQASQFVFNVQDPSGTNLRASRIADNTTSSTELPPSFAASTTLPINVGAQLQALEKMPPQNGLYIGASEQAGCRYRGQFRANKKEGLGIQTFPDGGVVEGNWLNGKIHGMGRYRFGNGDIYQGEFSKGLMSGRGTLKKPDGVIIQGQWWQDLPHGLCKQIWPDGSKFEGEFRKGKKNGQGRYVWADRAQITGNWVNGVVTGQGRAYWPDGRRYNGEWLNNRKHGRGIHTWKDGRRYEGEYLNDVRHGKGILILPNGAKYEGQWARGARHGKGIETTVDGKTFQGIWNNGLLAQRL